MTTLSCTGIINSMRVFSKNFWLAYKALEAVMNPYRFDQIKTTLMKSKRIDPKFLEEIDIAEFEQKKAEIEADWLQKSEDAKATGTAVHDRIHNLLVTDIVSCKKEYSIPTDLYKVQSVENFLKNDGLYPEFRMEVKLDDDYTLVGIADLIIKDGNRIKIIDFKTSDKIEMHSRYDMGKKKKQTFKFPISSVEQCNYNEYALQLSIYSWLIKKLNPDFEIIGLEIYHIQDMKLKKIYPVQEMKDEVEKLIPWHLKAVKLKKATEECREVIY